MDIIYGLLISFVFIVVSVWSALKLWDLFECDFKTRMNRELDQKQQLRRGVRENTDSRGDGWSDGGGFGDFGGGGDGGGA